jgi:hypothetical protein
MRNLIKTLVLLTLLGDRGAVAQTVGRSSAGPIMASPLARDTRLVGSAPMGHRQPHAADIPSENAVVLEQLSAEDIAVDRKLYICRGC